MKSGRRELNPRSRAPGARGIPGFPTSCSSRAPSGSRTRTSAMARRQAAATSWARKVCRIVKDLIDERAISARTVHAVDKSGERAPLTQWVGRCSNPRPLVFSQVLHHLSYRPKRKKPDVFGTPGFGYSSGKLRPGVTSAMDRTGSYSPIDRRMYPSLFALRNSGVWKSWLSFGRTSGSPTRTAYQYSIV